jgi:hypothetical protein
MVGAILKEWKIQNCFRRFLVAALHEKESKDGRRIDGKKK